MLIELTSILIDGKDAIRWRANYCKAGKPTLFLFLRISYRQAWRIPVLHKFLEQCSAIGHRQFFQLFIAGRVVLLYYFCLKNLNTWPGHRLFCHSLESVLWTIIMLKYSSSAKLRESRSHFVDQYFDVSTCI